MLSEAKKTYLFSENEKVVYPGHGVARIRSIIKKYVAGQEISFFELEILNKDMRVLVPTKNVTSVGIRLLSSSEHIDQILNKLSEPIHKTSFDLSGTNWNKRNKRYQEDIRQGKLESICKIYRDLKCVAQLKELSFGEKMLLQQTEGMIAQEIAFVQNVHEDKAVERLRTLVHASFKKVPPHIAAPSTSSG